MSRDIKQPIIIDLGSSQIKAGFYNIDSPSILMQNIIGEPLSKIKSPHLNKTHYIK